MFSFPLSDDIRDVLFETAYLMLRSGEKKKKVRSDCCEGVVKTDFGSMALYGTSGIVFVANLETEKGNLKASFLIRQQALYEMEQPEYGAWLTHDDIGSSREALEAKIRPNPIHRVAYKHHEN
ncbi:MAG TPA: hypothetical protein DDW41_07055 [Candidatus Andersenbacteria bacterium]|nr:hypothetical protein [Candidatus Andersenbacteria bacterium]